MNALRLRAIILFVILSILSLFFNDNPSFSEEGEKNISFRWAFGAMVGADNDRRLVAVTRDTVLKTGDQLKMLVELKERCFVYLFYHTGEGEVAMLFPAVPVASADAAAFMDKRLPITVSALAYAS